MTFENVRQLDKHVSKQDAETTSLLNNVRRIFPRGGPWLRA